ncbi:MAG: PilN domain-containing protein [Bdellovibrionota bacterium]
MIRINLVPVKVSKKEIEIRKQAILAGLVVLAALGTVYSLHNSITTKIDQVVKNTADTEAKLKQLDSTVKKIEEFKKQKAELEKKLDVINTLIKSRAGPVRVMAELAVSMPDKLWINDFNMSSASLELKGIADAESTVVDFAQRIKEQKHLGDVTIKELQGGKQNSPQGTLREYVEFTISCGVKLSG